jgi:hypothetical protein
MCKTPSLINKIILLFYSFSEPTKIEYNGVMFSAPRKSPRIATAIQSWGDRDETTEHFFIAIKKAEEFELRHIYFCYLRQRDKFIRFSEADYISLGIGGFR